MLWKWTILGGPFYILRFAEAWCPYSKAYKSGDIHRIFLARQKGILKDQNDLPHERAGQGEALKAKGKENARSQDRERPGIFQEQQMFPCDWLAGGLE